MDRYRRADKKRTKLGKEHYGSLMYPEIKIRNNDIYIYAKSEDRIDLLAYKYYLYKTLDFITKIYINK